METQSFDYNRWYAQSQLISAIRIIALADRNTTQENKTWATKIINESIDRPTIFTRRIKSTSSKNYGKTHLVFLFSNGEQVIKEYENEAAKIIAWFDENYPIIKK